MSYLAEAVVVLVGFVNSIIITRALGVEGRGQYALAMTVVTVLALVLGDGLSRANTYLAGRDEENATRLFGNLSVYTFALFLLLALTGLVALPLFRSVLPGLSDRLILLAIFVVPFLIGLRTINAIFLGMQRYEIYNLFLALPFILYLLANIVILKFSDLIPEKVLLNYWLAIVIAYGLIIYLFVNQGHAPWQTSAQLARESWHAGSRAAVSHISLFLLFRVDIFLINLFLGVGAAGLYSIAVLLAELVQKLANTSGNVIFPKIAKDRGNKSRKLTVYVLLFVVIVGLVFSVFMYLFGQELIVTLYKKEFAAAARPLFWLLPGTIFMAGAKILNFALWAHGFPRVTVYAPVAALVTNIVLNILLIPRFGIAGAAAATSTSFILYSIVLSVYYFKRFGFHQPVDEK